MNTIDEFLQLLSNVIPEKNNTWKACCPGHNDGKHKGDQSLSILLEGDKIVLHCFAGCKNPDIVRALDLKMSDLFLGKKEKPDLAEKQKRTRRRIEKVYPYYDMTGKILLFEVVRYKPKAFSQRRPDGKGGYINNLQGIEPVPYRLPQVLSAIGRKVCIHFPEGEKDADNLVKMNFEATTSPMGAAAWKPAYANFFHGASLVVIWVDKDKAGRAFAHEKALALIQTAHAVKVIEPPGKTVKDISDWIEAGAAAAQIQKLVDDSPFFEPPKDELAGFNVDLLNRTLRDLSDGRYSIIDGKFHRHIKTKEEELDLEMCNFVAEITEDITKDNGVDIERWLRIRGRLSKGDLLKLTMIPESNFNSMSWVRTKWGVKTHIMSGQGTNDHIRYCIELVSDKVKERMIYTHTGWRQINGKWCYLTSSGAIGDPDIECEMEGRFNLYALPIPSGNPLEAIKTSLDFLIIGRLEVTLPIWVAMYLAPLTPFEDTNFTIWYLGQTGSLKSTIIALALSHFGDFDAKHFTSSWLGTSNEIEHHLFIGKDIVVVADDYAPASDKAGQKELEAKTERILRAQGNRKGKDRMRPDLGSQATFDPRGLLVTSGEQPPHGQSRNARMLAVPIEISDISLEHLTRAQSLKEQYSLAMAHYILWIQEHWDKVRQEVRRIYDDARVRAAIGGRHLRLVDMVSSMYTGLNIALAFAQEKGAISDKEAKSFLEAGWQIFNDLASQQDIQVAAESPGKRFIEAIKTCLNSGKAVLRNPQQTDEVKPGQMAIGWTTSENKVLLNPGAAYEMVQDYYRRSGEDFTPYKYLTWRDLNRLHYIDTEAKPTEDPTKMVWIPGLNKSVRVLLVFSKYLGYKEINTENILAEENILKFERNEAI